jgi:hypothetical protein
MIKKQNQMTVVDILNFDILEKIDYIWEKLLELELATENELRLLTSINGLSVETLNDVLYYKTGYRDIDQMNEENN